MHRAKTWNFRNSNILKTDAESVDRNWYCCVNANVVYETRFSGKTTQSRNHTRIILWEFCSLSERRNKFKPCRYSASFGLPWSLETSWKEPANAEQMQQRTSNPEHMIYQLHRYAEQTNITRRAKAVQNESSRAKAAKKQTLFLLPATKKSAAKIILHGGRAIHCSLRIIPEVYR